MCARAGVRARVRICRRARLRAGLTDHYARRDSPGPSLSRPFHACVGHTWRASHASASPVLRPQAEGDLECVQADLDEISAVLLQPHEQPTRAILPINNGHTRCTRTRVRAHTLLVCA